MITYSNNAVFPASDPRHTGHVPTIEDIAVGLGRQVRFAGQTPRFYTVLCHSLVAGEVTKQFWPDDDVLRRYVLLHDAHEAIMGDTPTPWKCTGVTELEHELDQLIFDAYIGQPLSDENLVLLKQVDAACLAAEAHALGHARADFYWPRDDFGGLEALAFELTVHQLQVRSPHTYLNPYSAARALMEALEA